MGEYSVEVGSPNTEKGVTYLKDDIETWDEATAHALALSKKVTEQVNVRRNGTRMYAAQAGHPIGT